MALLGAVEWDPRYLICIYGLLKEAVLRCMDGSCCEWSK